jgi:signal transduction histidine kinase
VKARKSPAKGETSKHPVTRESAARKGTERALLKARSDLETAFDVLQAEVGRRMKAEQQLRGLTHRLVSAHEEERSRIARELHDQLGQLLTYLQMLLGQDEGELAQSGKTLGELRKILDQAMTLVRDLARELRPPLLEELGLLPALRGLVKQFSERTGIAVQCSFPEALALPHPAALAAYRIVQEALTNVARHAGTREAQVRVQSKGGTVTVEVQDSGLGFDMGHTGQSLGILGMQERALSEGGKLTIQSAEGAGTLVSARLPVKRA